MPTTNPVPSQDPSDLLFNAGRLDEVVNGTANSFTDRLGVSRRTVAGMNADFDAQLADAESDLNVYRADAAASAAEALGYLQTIRATSYGAYAEDPTTDPLGNPPTVGDEYFNTTANLLKRWNGSTWQASDINTANLAAPSGSSLIGHQQGGTGAVAATVEDVLLHTVSVFDFMTKAQIEDVKAGSLSFDVTNAVVNAFSHANSFAYTGLAPTIFHPGCELDLEGGKYNLASLTDKIYVKCNLKNKGAEFVVPTGYAGEVLRVGYDEAGKQLNSATISLPSVHKANGSAIVAGSVGVRLANINASKIYFGRVNHFETGVWMGGIGEGTVYCNIFLGQMSYNKRQIYIVPGAGGWFNANNVYGGNLYQGPIGALRLPGYVQLYADGSFPATTVVGNNFYNLSMEGPSSEYVLFMRNAYGNNFFGGYHESAIPAVDVTVSGDTFAVANPANRPSVGDKISVYASVMPSGMADNRSHYVVATPTDSTFKVSIDSGNTAGDTFSTAGTGVKFRLQCRMYFDSGAGENTFNNQFHNFFTPPTYGLHVIQNGVNAYGNGLDYQDQRIAEAYDIANVPMYRGVNFASTAAVRPVFAAYPPSIDPTIDPRYWSAALGDRGLLFAESGAETGRFFSSAGILQYRRPADSASFEIASCRRSPGLLNITSLSCAANAATTTDVTVTGASVNDHVLVTPVGTLTAGIIYSHAFVISANTVRVVFYNPTAAPISLTVTLQAMVVRRFF